MLWWKCFFRFICLIVLELTYSVTSWMYSFFSYIRNIPFYVLCVTKWFKIPLICFSQGKPFFLPCQRLIVLLGIITWAGIYSLLSEDATHWSKMFGFSEYSFKSHLLKYVLTPKILKSKIKYAMDQVRYWIYMSEEIFSHSL